MSRDYAERLAKEWCRATTATVLHDGTIAVATPFILDDGDTYPVIVRERSGGWQITDDGRTIAALRHDDVPLTPGRLAHIERLADSLGFVVEGGTLRRVSEVPPTVVDIADTIALIAQVLGIPLADAPREHEQIFRTRARDQTLRLLREPDAAVTDWAPPEDQRQAYLADLWMPSSANLNVVAFYAHQADKADRSINSIYQYARWDVNVRPLLVHDGALSSDVIYRAQTAARDDSSVVEIDERLSRQLGYAQLRRRLQERGVLVSG